MVATSSEREDETAGSAEEKNGFSAARLTDPGICALMHWRLLSLILLLKRMVWFVSLGGCSSADMIPGVVSKQVELLELCERTRETPLVMSADC